MLLKEIGYFRTLIELTDEKNKSKYNLKIIITGKISTNTNTKDSQGVATHIAYTLHKHTESRGTLKVHVGLHD